MDQEVPGMGEGEMLEGERNFPFLYWYPSSSTLSRAASSPIGVSGC